MGNTQRVARTASLLIIIFAIAVGAFAQDASSPPAGADVQYISLTPAEFAEKAPDLLNKDVEVAGDIVVPAMLSPRSVGTMVDKTTGKVLVQLTAKPGSPALQWLVGGDRKTKSQGIYARGKVVMARGSTVPVLDLTDISKESKVQAAAAMKAHVEAITNKDEAGLVKDVLPPHTNPSDDAAKAWLARIPTTSPSYDRAKTVWDNMVAHANWKMQADADDTRAIIRGPDRPANFETYYRSVRDTGLANLFAQSPYRNSSTSWPRVMIVIEEKPQFNGGMPSEFFHSTTKTETDYTWRFHATVWTDATHSIEIAPFNWCFSEMRYNTPYSEVPIWGRTPHPNITAPRGMGTPAAPGTSSAALPIPPRFPLPDSPDYHRTFHYDAIMVGNVLLDMGFNYTRTSDGRVWFVEDFTK
jgi:hypothetical protein